MEYEERQDIVYTILDLAKSNKLNNIQKQKLYNVVKSLKNKTETQKKRFYLFYNLEKGQTKTYRLCDLSKLFERTPNAISGSLGRIRCALVRINDERILELKEIVDEFKEKE